MADHGLDRADWNIISQLSKNSPDGTTFHCIVQQGCGTMSANVVDTFETHSTVFQCPQHGSGSSFSCGVRRSHMIRIAGSSDPLHFGVNHGVSVQRTIEILNDEKSRPFAKNQAIPVFIKGATGGSGHIAERSEANPAKICESFHTTYDHYVHFAIANHVDPLADGHVTR